MAIELLLLSLAVMLLAAALALSFFRMGQQARHYAALMQTIADAATAQQEESP